MVYSALGHEREQLEYTELWELPGGMTQEALAQIWSGVIEEWQPVVAASDLAWTGSDFAVLHGESARQVLVILQRYAATVAVGNLFAGWYKQRDNALLSRAQDIADEALATMKAMGLSEAELGGELSAMLSRAGFLKSFDDAGLDEARENLQAALRTGSADSWVTKWNLANVSARLGDGEAALALLDDVAEAISNWSGNAFVLFFVPDLSPHDSLVRITDAGIATLLELQRAVINFQRGDESGVTLAIEGSKNADDPAVVSAAGWTQELLSAPAKAK